MLILIVIQEKEISKGTFGKVIKLKYKDGFRVAMKTLKSKHKGKEV